MGSSTSNVEEERTMNVSVATRLGLAIAGLLIAGSALAQGTGGEPGPGMGPGMEQGMGQGMGMGQHRPPVERAFGGLGIQGRFWNNPKIAEMLKLTDEQKKQFDDILQAHREKLIDLRGNVEKAELAMAPLIRDDQPNEARILAQIDKLAQARAELEKANARYLLAIRSKLTPEQWKQVEDFRTNHMHEGHGWDPEGRMHGGPGTRQAPLPPPPGPQSSLDNDPGSEAPGTGADQ
jgi:Spy/CpxP family protein refolding chaperone